MAKITQLVKKDLKVFFLSKQSALIIAGVVFIAAYLFLNYLGHYNIALKQALAGQKLGLEKINLNSWVVENYYLSIALINLFLVPLLITRGIVEEKKQNTWHLLLTYPLSSWTLTLGKFFSQLLSLGIILLVIALFPLYLLMIAELEVALILSGFVGLFLCLALMLSVSMALTYFTDNQLVAGFLSFIILIFLFSLQILAARFNPEIAVYILNLSPFTHIKNLISGEIYYSSLIYFIGLTMVALVTLRQLIEYSREQGRV